MSTCPVCACFRLKPLPRYRRAHLARCRDCGMVFANRRPTDAELALNYGGYSRTNYDSPITRQRYRELLDGFERYRRTNRILDMGCGIGFFLDEARKRGWQVQGSEFEPRAVEINREMGLDCVQAPVDTSTFERDRFDVITAFEVVEHVQDPLAEAEVIAHALRPGGLFYCTTPNFRSLSRHLLRDRWGVISYPEHLLYFTPSTLRSWLRGYGLVPVKMMTRGIALARLQQSIRQPGPALEEEQLRVRIEGSGALRMAKATVNSVLSATRSGDTIQGYFELQGKPATQDMLSHSI